jgi:cyclase
MPANSTNPRIIPRLDIKGPNLIKGVHLEGLRVIGNPQEHARRYYHDGADELICIDIVASLYGRNNLSELVSEIAANVFIPITVGGGIRTLDDARRILRSGADKVAINTAAIAQPVLISDVARHFGSQAMVLSIEAKALGKGRWQAYTDNGRERTGRDVLSWAVEAVSRGAGEILLTSIDREGTRNGFDIELIESVRDAVSVPVIASGGMGTLEDFNRAVVDGGADGVAMADILHYNRASVGDIRSHAANAGLAVRRV